MNTVLAAIGRLRPGIRELCDDYVTRISRHDRFTERELREGSSSRPVTERKRIEGERLLEVLPQGSTVIALDRSGDAWSSEELARRLEGWRVDARPVGLVIGGPDGLDQSVLEQARFRWSLSPLTLPHELARLVVLEQWYRAWTILRGEPYHR